MIEHALEEIRKAENEADRLVEEAKRKSSSIISEAKEKAAKMLKETEERLAQKKAQSEGHRKEKTLELRSKILGEGSIELKSLRKSAAKKTDEAAELVLEAFDREVSNS